MSQISFPYGKTVQTIDLPDDRLRGVLRSRMHAYRPAESEEALVAQALAQPVGTPRLRDMAAGKRKVVIIASDHTRPVPSKIIMPQMLAEIRAGNPDAEITILIATGCHRGTTRDELVGKFGEEIVAHERIYIHDCTDESMLTSLGKLPSGGELWVNRLAAEADLLCAEGFIEPHFFAGFSGGRKSVLPGVAARKTVLANHCAAFIDSPCARTGRIDGNPIHTDMLYAARAARLDFIVNVVINAEKQVVYAVAGDCDLAHRTGVAFLRERCMVSTAPADIAISSNSGYPLDQNVYQSVKGMTAAEAAVRAGGVIIMLASASDGHGGESFYDTFRTGVPLPELYASFMARSPSETIPDQWESQILTRILMHARVIYISDLPDEMVREFRMIPAHSLPEALAEADRLLGYEGSIVAIPDGVAVMVQAQE